MINNSFASPYILAFVLAWVMAHTIKYIVSRFKKEKHSVKDHVFRSGGMPSAHSATATALLIVIAWQDGVGSGLFGLSALMSLVIMYDALKVRRSTGEQGVAVQKIIKHIGEKSIKQPYVARGHLPIEVLAGASLGATIGVFVILLTTIS